MRRLNLKNVTAVEEALFTPGRLKALSLIRSREKITKKELNRIFQQHVVVDYLNAFLRLGLIFIDNEDVTATTKSIEVSKYDSYQWLKDLEKI